MPLDSSGIPLYPDTQPAVLHLTFRPPTTKNNRPHAILAV